VKKSMKKNAIVCAAVVLAVFTAACSKKTIEMENKQSTAVPSGVVLLNGTGLYTEQDDGKMKYTTSANAGETLELVLIQKEDSRKKSVEMKNAARTDGQTRDFIHVIKNKKDLWIQTALFAPNTKPVVIISNDAVMYKDADISGVLGTTYPQYLVAAAGESKNDFVRMYAYIEGVISANSSDRYVKEECISYNTDDVKAMQLLTAARTTKNDTAKKELLKNAIELNSSFNDMIKAEYETAFPDKTNEKDMTSESESGQAGEESVNSNAAITSDDGSLVNVRETPDVNAAIVKQLATGTAVYYEKISDSTDEINGVSDYWYQISYPVKGWVFGEFVES
jgi:hypothetical protein